MIDLEKYEDAITFKQELEIGGISVCRDDVLDLITRLRQAEKDAARYRWLRDEAINSQVVSPLVFNADECAIPLSWIDGDHLDYAVDGAMQCER